ncbi:hypothetical protein DL96DRAFT_1607851 [Flagelloscypha sp. PMI_526]|nr:hypothetical protein DL96DRAFT_1607851 [Flagelloscypha sp. PMI_526]
MPLRFGDQCEACQKHIQCGGSCPSCLPSNAKLKRCAGCQLTLYCDKRCQTRHRNLHKPHCVQEQAIMGVGGKEYQIFKKWCLRTCHDHITSSPPPNGTTPTADDILLIVTQRNDSDEKFSTLYRVWVRAEELPEKIRPERRPCTLYIYTIESAEPHPTVPPYYMPLHFIDQ